MMQQTTLACCLLAIANLGMPTQANILRRGMSMSDSDTSSTISLADTLASVNQSLSAIINANLNELTQLQDAQQQFATRTTSALSTVNDTLSQVVADTNENTRYLEFLTKLVSPCFSHFVSVL